MSIAAPRYTDADFPAYRFIPGVHPHPTADPRGHSHLPPGEPHPVVVFKPPEEWDHSFDYLYGCDLYNHAYWWEAHEAWEGLWQLTDKKGAQGHFLQLIIQVSACHLKLHTGKLEGVLSLRRSSRGHFDAWRRMAAGSGPGQRSTCEDAPFMGLPVQRWYAEVEAYYDARLRTIGSRRGSSVPGARLEHEFNAYPYIRLCGERSTYKRQRD